MVRRGRDADRKVAAGDGSQPRPGAGCPAGGGSEAGAGALRPCTTHRYQAARPGGCKRKTNRRSCQVKSDEGLVRAVGVRGLTAGMINYTIGAGIFVLPA